jgi:hypothetical protein
VSPTVLDMSVLTSITRLSKHNYRTWAVEAEDLLKHLNVWHVVDGSEIVPQPPAAAASGTATPTALDHLDPKYSFQPQSTALTYHDNFLQDWRAYRNRYDKAKGTICSLLEPSIRSRYTGDKFDDLKVL